MNTLVGIGYARADVLEMTYSEITAYSAAYYRDENEKSIVMMNCMAVAFGGSAKDRKKMADALLGKADTDFDPAEFESVFANLATPVETEHQTEAKAWAATEFNVDDPAFKAK